MHVAFERHYHREKNLDKAWECKSCIVTYVAVDSMPVLSNKIQK